MLRILLLKNPTNELSPDFYPTEPAISRQAEVDEIYEQSINQDRGVYLWAKKGVGKTFVARQLQKKIERTIYVPLGFSVPRSLASFLDVRAAYVSGRLGPASRQFQIHLKNKFSGSNVLIIFDDIQQVRRPKDLFYFLKDCWDETRSYSNVKASFMLISQLPYQKLESILPMNWDVKESVESRMQLFPVSLKPYSVEEIAAILTERLKLAGKFRGEDKEMEAVRFFAATTFRQGSDMRLGLRLLKSWVTQKDQTTSPEQIWTSERQRYWREQLETLHPHQAALLATLARSGGRILYPKLYQEYAAFCRSHHGEGLDYTQVHRLLDDLDHLGFVDRQQERTRGQPYSVRIHETIQAETISSALKYFNWRAL